MKPDWIDRFPGLARLRAEHRATLVAGSTRLSLPAGRRVFGPGVAPAHYLLLLRGTVRVQQRSEQGREIVLYRITAGESCPLTVACLMSYDAYPAEAVVEAPSEAMAITRSVFDILIARSAEFRRYVFGAFSERVTDLCRVIDDVAFGRIDIRLAHKLVELADRNGIVTLTHEQLAVELGSVREVISRQLRDFHRRGWVIPGRGRVTVADRGALLELARTA